jgi:hypothetical protein
MSTPHDLYDLEVTTIDGKTQKLSAYAGKTLLVVNVASKCGFTPQYTGLEALYRKYRDRGLVVLGFPCDQFGHQEPGDAEEIKSFCSLKYDVTFPMFAKVEVNGEPTPSTSTSRRPPWGSSEPRRSSGTSRSSLSARAERPSPAMRRAILPRAWRRTSRSSWSVDRERVSP